MSSTTPVSISAADGGSEAGAAELFTSLYFELRAMARRQAGLAGGRYAAIEASSLLHRAFLAIRRNENAVFPDRAHFMAYAAKVMRRLIIDQARAQCARKRGGQFELTFLEAEQVAEPQTALVDAAQLEELSNALDALARFEPELAEIVDLKFFCGIPFKEIAELLEVSERTLQRRWDKARLILHHHLSGVGPM